MGDAGRQPVLHEIKDQSAYDAAIAHAVSGHAICMLIYADSSPACKTAMPKLESLAQRSQYADTVTFYKMELNSSTSPMIKLALQNCPSFIIMKGERAQTVVGPNLVMVERALEGMR